MPPSLSCSLSSRGREEIGCLAGFAKQSDREAAQGWGWSSETTVDQTLIRGLGTGLPCLRLGAVLGLEGGPRAHRLGT
ncbi:hypothetical protein MPLDJ20_220012 [Mesorhizobium plurifarium]|uniref:Uncharacterized protein n=1 Tax=Mesorhizobium plurifarium TaxID=69974 RepID=A0A090F2P7_MESPL|nr:hypothetical protein MPLDJ20_220012 [Mesorhizobium plurifarium]